MPFLYDSDLAAGPRFPGGQPVPIMPRADMTLPTIDVTDETTGELTTTLPSRVGGKGGTVPRPGPTTVPDVMGAAAIRQNLPVSAYRYFRDRAGFETDPNHNPLDLIAGTKYEADYLDNFLNSWSEGETRAIMRHIDEEEAARKTLAAAGAFGVVAEIGAGLADPTIFMPGTVFLKGGRAGWEVGRLALGVGAAATAQAAVQEGALAATQETRTGGEVALNVGSATLLGGLLGAGAGALLSRVERQALTAALDGDRKAMAADISPMPQAAGAAAVDTRQLKLQGYFLDKLPGVRALTERISPTMRIWTSDFVTAKRALADLAETPLRFEENAQGVATTQGPAVDRMARMLSQRQRAAAGQKLDQAYAKYRFGQTDVGFTGAQVAKIKGIVRPVEGKMSPLEFREAIGKAMRNGDKSDIPEVAEVAQFLRREVFEPWKARAIKAGLLPEDVETTTAESYFMRVYNKQKIDAQRPVFQGRIADWLESEQANKAAIKAKLEDLTGQIDALQARAAEADATTAKAAELEAELNDLTARVEEQVRAWKGKSAWEAEKAIEKRIAAAAEKPEGAARSASADKAVSRAVRRMLAADTDLSRAEIESRAGEIVDRISVAPDGRLAYDAPSGGPRAGFTGEGPRPRGPLAHREFMIPDAMIEDFLVSDVEEVMQTYLRSMVPDVLLTEKFGDVDMADVFKKLREEHGAKALAAKSDKARTALRKEYETVVSKLAAIRDRVRNVYMADTRMRNLGRATAAVKTYNMLTDLGGVTITSLSDVAGPVFLHGFGKVLSQGWRPFLKNLTGIRSGYAGARLQYKAMGIAVETQLAARMNDAYSLVDIYRNSSRAERVLGGASDAYFLSTLLGPWTDFGKTITAVVSGNEIFRAAKAVSEGAASTRQLEALAASGIDREMAGRIWRSFEAGGNIVDGVHIPNTADWTDTGARLAFEGAVGREADMAIITPGQEKPLWMNHPIASLLGQYKTFAAAATERYLIAGLQRSDAAVLSGLTAGVAAGMLSFATYSLLTGRELPTNPADWVREGLSRSGAIGWFEEGRALVEKATGGTVDPFRLLGSDRPSSRYASRSAFSQLLGPTWGKIEGLGLAAGNAAQGSWSASDTRRLRRVTALQNLFYVRWLFDQVERGTNNLLGVDQLPGNPKK